MKRANCVLVVVQQVQIKALERNIVLRLALNLRSFIRTCTKIAWTKLRAARCAHIQCVFHERFARELTR